MAICKYCDRDMTTARGCLVQADSEKRALRIPFGAERTFRSKTPIQPGERCHDCGVVCGELHHPGCDAEECPRCGGQRFGCPCTTEATAQHADPDRRFASGLRVLPVYAGWTIDLRCRQFRKVHEDGWIDFVEFDSSEGDRLLSRFVALGIDLEPVVIA